MLTRRKGFASYWFAVSGDLSSNIRAIVPGDHSNDIVYNDAYVNTRFIGAFEFVYRRLSALSQNTQKLSEGKNRNVVTLRFCIDQKGTVCVDSHFNAVCYRKCFDHRFILIRVQSCLWN